MSIYDLVTLLNRFPNLVRLILHNTIDTVDGNGTPQLFCFLKNLSISHVDYEHEVVTKLSTLKLQWKELSLNILRNEATAQSFIEGSKDYLMCLDLMNTVECTYCDNPTICSWDC